MVGSMICKCDLLGLNHGQGIIWLLEVNTMLMIGFEVFTAVEIKLIVLRIMICNFICDYQSFGDICCFFVMVATCINDMRYFIVQLMHSVI